MCCHRGIKKPKVFTFSKLEEENFDIFFYLGKITTTINYQQFSVIDLIVDNLLKNVVDLERLIINQPEFD